MQGIDKHSRDRTNCGNLDCNQIRSQIVRDYRHLNNFIILSAMIAQTYDDSFQNDMDERKCKISMKAIANYLTCSLVINGVVLIALSIFTHVFTPRIAYIMSIVGSIQLSLVVVLVWKVHNRKDRQAYEDSTEVLL